MYESHITVQMDREKFRAICSEHGLKSILITHDSGSSLPEQMMTARFHKTSSVVEAMKQLLVVSKLFGSAVIRRKLEKIVPKDIDIPCLYKEYHIKYLVPKRHVASLVATVAVVGGKTSFNQFKSGVNDETYVFATARDEILFNKLLNLLPGTKPVSVIRECVVYDDNPSIDGGWNECFSCPIKEKLYA